MLTIVQLMHLVVLTTAHRTTRTLYGGFIQAKSPTGYEWQNRAGLCPSMLTARVATPASGSSPCTFVCISACIYLAAGGVHWEIQSRSETAVWFGEIQGYLGACLHACVRSPKRTGDRGLKCAVHCAFRT
ncbi:hypothetical protein BZA05DRAFT_401022 [Tricharina praecox]|uniref:uncharacterized protein n=1 Tax=Tricharina praecox TaxID=43433 RepID=UPI00221EAFF0|nr:uncharacterized protein BZA05DRAFT_413821 [Tricharina praecox]XP_051338768.1 uncharacterized protein BZA05DRAFT_401022 [Tricharina praecox]KAI5840885.1 hypothetical protein BZA05DRAFT_413821 [Tricharina praecox]KAI5850124.1 hypothetical protein BZA05DRAFT_401022 [Tricharina praecox]